MSPVQRRSARLPYSKEFESILTATPIGRVQEATVSSSQTSIYKQWHSDSGMQNIRLTPLRTERTDYTYGDSGSYRTNRVDNDWEIPDMSRLPLYQSSFYQTNDLKNPQSRPYHKQIGLDMNSKSSKDFTLTPKIDLDHDEVSSRSSVSSSRSSSRTIRSRCKLIAGDWCTHEECTVHKTSKTRRISSLESQRNTNNTNDSPHLLPTVDTPRLSTGRQRRLRRTIDVDADATMFNSTNPSTPMNQSSNRLASASSTFVYTYVPDDADKVGMVRRQPNQQSLSKYSGDGPDVGLSNPEPIRCTRNWVQNSGLSKAESSVVGNDRSGGMSSLDGDLTKSGNWLTKHIYGLDQSNNAHSKHRYITSDTEDVDMSSRSRSRRVGVRRSSKSINPMTSTHPHSLFSRKQSGPTFRVQATQLLFTFSTICRSWFQTVVDACRSSSTWLFRFEGDSSNVGNSGVHSRLGRYGDQNGESRVLRSRTIRSQYAWSTTDWIRLVAAFCICVPLLLLLLAWLLTPLVDERNPPIWSPILPDVACRRDGLVPIWDSGAFFQLTRWRLRCLYHLYNAPGDQSPPPKRSSWWSWGWWEWDSSPTIPTLTDVDKDRLADQLSKFSKQVSSRLDQLSKSLHDAHQRIELVELQTGNKLNAVGGQLSTLQDQLTKQSASLDKFNAHLQSLSLLIGQSGSKGGQLPTVDFDRLFVAVLHAANETIRTQVNLLRMEMETSGSVRLEHYNASVARLSLLQSQFRDQLLNRISQIETKILQLHSEAEVNRKSTDHVKLSTELHTLQHLVNQLSSRLTEQQRLSSEASGLQHKLQDAVKKCTDDHSQQLDTCRLAATRQTESAFAQLSEKLQRHITELVKEQFLRDLEGGTLNSSVLLKLDKLIREAIHEALTKHNYNGLSAGGSLLPAERGTMQQLIDEALYKFAADRTGMADYALESAGGSIVGTRCTRTYTDGAALFSVFGIPLARLNNSPRTIIQPGNNPGDCWPFHGSSGQAIIRLSAPIHVSAVSLEHLPRSLAPNSRVDSAPKDFLIKGLASEHDEDGILLGKFSYDTNLSAIQTFPIKDQTKPWQLIEFAVLSNHGHPSYTCVYRLRVHGSLVTA